MVGEGGNSFRARSRPQLRWFGHRQIDWSRSPCPKALGERSPLAAARQQPGKAPAARGELV